MEPGQHKGHRLAFEQRMSGWIGYQPQGCFSCGGSNPGGCMAKCGTGVIPGNVVKCFKCGGTGGEQNSRCCQTKGYLQFDGMGMKPQRCFSCGGTGCINCNQKGHIVGNAVKCFKCGGKGTGCMGCRGTNGRLEYNYQNGFPPRACELCNGNGTTGCPGCERGKGWVAGTAVRCPSQCEKGCVTCNFTGYIA